MAGRKEGKLKDTNKKVTNGFNAKHVEASSQNGNGIILINGKDSAHGNGIIRNGKDCAPNGIEQNTKLKAD